MSNKRLLQISAFFMLTIVSVSCLKDSLKRKFVMLKPVYALKQDVYAAIKSSTPQPIVAPGKMFLLGDYIYLTEKGKGIHIIDQSNPNALQNISFIPIPGNEDVAVKDNYLYADCATDLLVIDVSQPTNAVFTKFLPNIFPDKFYINGYYVDSMHVIVDWVMKDTMMEQKYFNQHSQLVFEDNFNGPTLTNSGNVGTTSTGTGGSMSRFGIVSNYLYTVTTSHLNAVNISDPANPVAASSTEIGWNIETIYPFRNNLFIGAMSGMYIYNVDDPAHPQQMSMFAHANVCDPVIADDHHAYVTLCNGNDCGGTINELNVLNVDNLSSPQLIQTLQLTNPRGLSKDENLLFICDGLSGLRILDAANPSDVNIEQTIAMATTNDVIARDNIAYVVAEDGLYLYDYSNYPSVVKLGKVGFSR